MGVSVKDLEYALPRSHIWMSVWMSGNQLPKVISSTPSSKDSSIIHRVQFEAGMEEGAYIDVTTTLKELSEVDARHIDEYIIGKARDIYEPVESNEIEIHDGHRWGGEWHG